MAPGEGNISKNDQNGSANDHSVSSTSGETLSDTPAENLEKPGISQNSNNYDNVNINSDVSDDKQSAMVTTQSEPQLELRRSSRVRKPVVRYGYA